MYGRKLGMGLSSQFGLPLEEQVPLLREVGFEAFFCEWAPGADVAPLGRAADEYGMIFQSIHAPFVLMHSMWYRTEHTDTALAQLLECVRVCAGNQVPMMVVHPFIGFTLHEPTPLGLANYERVAKAARELGVQIALENTEGEEYLAALMDHFKGWDNVGFCLDTGHELCYNKGKDMLALYGDRLIATHLNDNLGIRDCGGEITFLDDLHLLPFDGVADWEDIARRLNRCAYDGILSFELNTLSKPGRCENDGYARMTTREFFTAAYARACRVAALAARCR